MDCIAYFSTAAVDFSPIALSALIDGAAANNARAGLTGVLCYHDGNFLQFLEGEPDKVRAVFARIVADPRHFGVIELFNGPITRRQFADWTMALRRVDQLSPPQQGVVQTLSGLRLAPAESNDHRRLIQGCLDAFRLSVP